MIWLTADHLTLQQAQQILAKENLNLLKKIVNEKPKKR